MVTMTNYLTNISRLFEKDTIVLAPTYHFLSDSEESVMLLSDIDEVKEMILALSVKIDERFQNKRYDYIANILIYNMSVLVDELDTNSQNELSRILEKGYKVGYLTESSLSKKYDSASKQVRSFKQALIGVRLNDQQVIEATNRPLRESMLDLQVNYFVQDKWAIKTKMFIE